MVDDGHGGDRVHSGTCLICKSSIHVYTKVRVVGFPTTFLVYGRFNVYLTFVLPKV